MEALWSVLPWHQGKWREAEAAWSGFSTAHPEMLHSFSTNLLPRNILCKEWKVWPQSHPQHSAQHWLIRYKMHPQFRSKLEMRIWHEISETDHWAWPLTLPRRDTFCSLVSCSSWAIRAPSISPTVLFLPQPCTSIFKFKCLEVSKFASTRNFAVYILFTHWEIEGGAWVIPGITSHSACIHRTTEPLPSPPLTHVPRCHIHMAFKSLQGWGLQHCPDSLSQHLTRLSVKNVQKTELAE